MALDFTNAGSDRVVVTDASSIQDLTAFTFMVWVFANSKTANDRFMQKTQSTNFKAFSVSGAGPGNISLFVNRATTVCNTRSQIGDWSTGAWQFIAVTYDESDGGRIFVGGLNAIITEIASYDVRDVGSGATNDDNGNDLYIGNSSGATNSFDGDIATAQVFNKRMVLGEIRQQQFYPHATPECVVYHQLGYYGTGTQPDWSGNGNTGAVTGATVADHVPLALPVGFDQGWMGAFGAEVAVGGVSLAERGIMRGHMRGVGRGI